MSIGDYYAAQEDLYRFRNEHSIVDIAANATDDTLKGKGARYGLFSEISGRVESGVNCDLSLTFRESRA